MENTVGYKNFKIYIFDYIPEINQDTKKLITNQEIYNTLFRFACNDMIFINLFRVSIVNSQGAYNSIILEKEDSINNQSEKSPLSQPSDQPLHQRGEDRQNTNGERGGTNNQTNNNNEINQEVEDDRPPLGYCYMAIIYFPYTPEYILNPKKASTHFCKEMAEYLNLSDKYLFQHRDTIIRQKLVDLYYAAEDGESFHLILDCHSKTSECNDIASQFCNNNMCKRCCQADPNRTPCVLHDNYGNIVRHYISEVIEFERQSNFDVTKTIKLVLSSKIKLREIKKLFEDLEV